MANHTAAPRTIGEALNYCHDALVAGGVFFGHGTDNAWDEAVQLVLLAGTFARGGDVFVLDMGKPVPIRDVARKMIEGQVKFQH